MLKKSNSNVTDIDFKFRNLRHVLMPGQLSADFPATNLYNAIYQFWITFWHDVLKNNGSQEELDPYDFYRSQFVSAILDGDTVVGMHLYTIFNFEQANVDTHPYLRGEHERCFIDGMRSRSCKTAMALEFLTVNAEWRKSKVGLSFAPVVTGLGYHIQKELSVDATLGRCRTDVKSNVLMTDVGGITLKQNVMMHNTPVDFCAVFLKSMTAHPDLRTQNLIDLLWKNRMDYTGITTPKINTKKVA